MPNAYPYIHVSLQEVNTRNEYARRVLAGFRAAMPTLTDVWQYLEDVLNDALTLAAEITRLTDELKQARLERANLHAAMRAALAAHTEGEPDPMWYLRDELGALSDTSEMASGASWGQA